MTVPARLSPSALALPLAAALLFAAPLAAVAQGCTGAPGASAIQQYCEAVPSADGGSDRPGRSSSSGGSGSGGSGSGVSSSTAKTLSDAGTDGAAIERLAGGTKSSAKATPKPKAGNSTSAASSAEGGDGAVLSERVEGPADPDGSPLKAATSAVSNGPTAGTGLAWSLAGLSIVGVAAGVFLRRRGGSLDDPGDDA